MYRRSIGVAVLVNLFQPFLQENLRAVVEEIISDSTGQSALKYINSRSDLLRNVARLVRKNINDFNVPITPYELINEASCIEPPQQAFTLPDMRTTHHQDTPPIHNPDPWTPPTYKPRQQTTPTHKHYPHTRPTHKPYPWTHSTHKPRPQTTPNQNPHPQTTPTHKPYPWTRSTRKPYTRTAPTHKPYPWTRPTHKSYSRTRSTSRPEQWSRHPTRRTYYRSARRPIYPQLQHWSQWWTLTASFYWKESSNECSAPCRARLRKDLFVLLLEPFLSCTLIAYKALSHLVLLWTDEVLKTSSLSLHAPQHHCMEMQLFFET